MSLIKLLRLSISPLPISAGWYALPLRLIIGFGFMQHGYAKLQCGPEDFINVLHAMGLPIAFILGWATIVVELVGGLMILAGALIPVAIGHLCCQTRHASSCIQHQRKPI